MYIRIPKSLNLWFYKLFTLLNDQTNFSSLPELRTFYTTLNNSFGHHHYHAYIHNIIIISAVTILERIKRF